MSVPFPTPQVVPASHRYSHLLETLQPSSRCPNLIASAWETVGRKCSGCRLLTQGSLCYASCVLSLVQCLVPT